MSDQNLNRHPTRVVRIDKVLANRIDSWAVDNGMTIREIVDAIVSDFLSSSPSVQKGAMDRWSASGRVAPKVPIRNRTDRPLSVREWKRLCSAERAEPARCQDEETSE
jgi:hypothetical protein